MASNLLNRIGIPHPIIQAPMGGANATPPALVAAVSNAGGLGFLGAAYMSPEQIVAEGKAIRALTKKPFGINLFVPVPSQGTGDEGGAMPRIAGYHAELGLPAPSKPTLPAWSFEDQVAAVLETGAPVFSFTFGLLPESQMRVLKERDVLVIGTATTVEEARQLERTGVDALATQGSEAGAHRGSFIAPSFGASHLRSEFQDLALAASFETSMVGTMALVPQVVDAVDVPVIAAGGIMDGRGIAAALALGAQAVAMGTAFLVTDECGVAESYKRAVLGANDHSTKVTRAFSGRPARGIVNRAMKEIERDGRILPYPYQNSLTRAMRTEAAKQDRAEFLSLWAGQGAHLARRMPAAKLVETLVAELAEQERRIRRAGSGPSSLRRG